MKIFTARKNGFTLLEFLVSVGLIAIFTALGVVNFQSTSRRQKLLGTAANVRQLYVGAKSNALSGKKNCQECGALAPTYACGVWNAILNRFYDDPLVGWEVFLDTQIVGANTVWRSTVQGVCGLAENPTAAGQRRFIMEGGTAGPDIIPDVNISITGPVSGNRVVFRSSGGGIWPSFRAVDPPLVFTISDNFGNSQRFNIDGAGVVSQLY